MRAIEVIGGLGLLVIGRCSLADPSTGQQAAVAKTELHWPTGRFVVPTTMARPNAFAPDLKEVYSCKVAIARLVTAAELTALRARSPDPHGD
jgi:hypothetical protein